MDATFVDQPQINPSNPLSFDCVRFGSFFFDIVNHPLLVTLEDDGWLGQPFCLRGANDPNLPLLRPPCRFFFVFGIARPNL
ncbi:hypothetical protein CDAR_575071 [Caerostris darwini]|uniref:Uncharacterized protein n=1 Tax=Caerostris darwini TaxID=1538125 RepID=A0AAV4T4B1_9ARAC|nr:hypothetical protein CDAR_575071 [Caerostris darwini]